MKMNKNTLLTLAFAAAAMAQPASAMDYVNKVLPKKYRSLVALVGGFTLGATAVYCLLKPTQTENNKQINTQDQSTQADNQKMYTIKTTFCDASKKGFLHGKSEQNHDNFNPVYIDEESLNILNQTNHVIIACLGNYEMKLYSYDQKKYFIVRYNESGSSLILKDKRILAPAESFRTLQDLYSIHFWEPFLCNAIKVTKNGDSILFTIHDESMQTPKKLVDQKKYTEFMTKNNLELYKEEKSTDQNN